MLTSTCITEGIRVYGVPDSFSRYLTGQLVVMGQVRSSLYQVDANLGYWKKLLDQTDSVIQEGLTKDEQKAAKKKQTQVF